MNDLDDIKYSGSINFIMVAEFLIFV